MSLSSLLLEPLTRLFMSLNMQAWHFSDSKQESALHNSPGMAPWLVCELFFTLLNFVDSCCNATGQNLTLWYTVVAFSMHAVLRLSRDHSFALGMATSRDIFWPGTLPLNMQQTSQIVSANDHRSRKQQSCITHMSCWSSSNTIHRPWTKQNV